MQKQAKTEIVIDILSFPTTSSNAVPHYINLPESGDSNAPDHNVSLLAGWDYRAFNGPEQAKARC